MRSRLLCGFPARSYSFYVARHEAAAAANGLHFERVYIESRVVAARVQREASVRAPSPALTPSIACLLFSKHAVCTARDSRERS